MPEAANDDQVALLLDEPSLEAAGADEFSCGAVELEPDNVADLLAV